MVQHFTEICRQVYADRSEFLGDADFTDIPLKKTTLSIVY